MILTGTIVNSAAIVAGSIAGLLLGKFIPERFSDAMEKGAALCVLYIGVDGMLAGENTLVAILSISIGAILGELLQLDEHMHQLGDWVEQKFGGKGSKTSLSEGFVTASLLFCVGAMAIMGALDSGLTGDHSTLYAKALLDGIISVVYASTLGIGVALVAVDRRRPASRAAPAPPPCARRAVPLHSLAARRATHRLHPSPIHRFLNGSNP